MTRILVQRGSGSSSTSQNRPSSSSVPPPTAPQGASTTKEEQEKEQIQDPSDLNDLMQHCVGIDENVASSNEIPTESSQGSKIDTNIEQIENKKPYIEESVESAVRVRVSGGLHLSEKLERDDSVSVVTIGSRRQVARPVVSTWSSASESGLLLLLDHMRMVKGTIVQMNRVLVLPPLIMMWYGNMVKGKKKSNMSLRRDLLGSTVYRLT
ncbi:hypothetical protein M5K25_002602 [Dendrobium thyrsiflorum]|uniref:Uncharacterized protein n=1 Tax=Dendrobium thyrsiflorum TaxID=117978 RepID=A0ABD0VP11_DENTH